MQRPHHSDHSTADTLEVTDRVLDTAGHDGQSRRALLGRAGGLLAAGAALSFPDGAAAATRDQTAITTLLTTYEHFGVTFLSEAIRRAPGTPSAAFVPVLKAANTTEYQHLVALKRIGGTPLSTRFWIPDAAFGGGGAKLFQTLETQEEIEISAYLIGVTAFCQTNSPFRARLCAEALGTESEHRVLARFARGKILGLKAAPNNKGFESFPYHTPAAAQAASEKLGIGIGKEGAKPGKFYEFPGDPRPKGLGSPTRTPTAA